MLKTCRSGCGLVHPPPYGIRCKTVIAWKMAGKGETTGAKTLDEKMAEAGFTSREDPKYLEYLEQEMIKALEVQTDESRAMTSILSRLERIESNQTDFTLQLASRKEAQSPVFPVTTVPLLHPQVFTGQPSLPQSLPTTTQSALPIPSSQALGSMPQYQPVGVGARSKLPTDYLHQGNEYGDPRLDFHLPQYGQIGNQPPTHRAAFNAALRGVNVPTAPRVGPRFADQLSTQAEAVVTPLPPPSSTYTQPPGHTYMQRMVGPAPADVVDNGLSSVLQQLSLAIDPTPVSSSKGLGLRPEYYVQHKDQGIAIKSLDYLKLTYKQLVYGMGRVLKYLFQNGGDFVSYLDHYNFITMQASRHSFSDVPFAGYDRFIIDRFLNAESDSFGVDPVGVASYFHAANVKSEKTFVSRQRVFHSKGKKSQVSDGEKGQSMPEGFPDDVCYNYNYKTCTGSCRKSHICKSCKGKHPASKCTK